MIYPFYNCFVTSVLPYEYATTFGLYLVPPALDFINYTALLTSPVILSGFRVTFIITLLGTLYNMALTITMGYALSRKGYKGRNFFIMVVLVTMFFSGGMIPGYILVRNLGLMDTLLSMILPVGIAPFWLILTKNYMSSIPDSLEESARIDGANDLTIMVKIIVPLSLPIIATVTLFYGVARWNEWFSGMLYIRTPGNRPLQLLLRDMLVRMDTALMDQAAAHAIQGHQRIYSQSMRTAMVMITSIPILCLYPFLQKYFVQGIMIGSIKG
ncbi:MAG: carbohydrate ABC transporter permease [Oscillospiraceae bacterium]|nr:carbohydrate ABC transporter permease [Oscillospiraceae bacterium]